MKKRAPGLNAGSDGVLRCFWAGDDLEYQRYHDEEWGVPVTDDVRLYEKLCLEGFQSGLSWRTILHKRPAFRAAFADFDFHRVAKFNQKDVKRLLGDAGIVRHRGKIEATIVNAGAVVRLREEGTTLASFVWAFEPDPKTRPKRLTLAAMKKLTATDASTALSKALKKRGFRFVGPTTAYAFMQSMGIVNDHLEGCPRRADVEALRSAKGPVPMTPFS